MKTENDLRLTLSMIPDNKLSQENKEILIVNSLKYNELLKFIMNKYSVDESVAENMITVYSSSRLDESKYDAIDNENELKRIMFNDISLLVQEFAQTEGFEKSEEVGASFLAMVEIIS